MKIPVAGMDPSLRHWGIAEGVLDLQTGILEDLQFTLVVPKDLEGKQVRQNSSDLYLAEQLSEKVIPVAQRSKAIFVEVPVGSKSARAMASYGVCVGILGSIRSLGIPLIEVTALESKLVFTGDREATKQKMIYRAVELYPYADFPRDNKGKLLGKCEHLADATAAIHSGVRTPVFQNLMRLFQGV